MNIPTSPLKPPLPPLPPPAVAHHSGLSDSSPLLPIITILAFVIIVVLIYAAFFAIRCPTTISNSGRPAGNLTSTHIGTSTDALDQLVSSVVYKEAADTGKEGCGECPVCLTAFVDGEVIREVKVLGGFNILMDLMNTPTVHVNLGSELDAEECMNHLYIFMFGGPKDFLFCFIIGPSQFLAVSVAHMQCLENRSPSLPEAIVG